MMIQEKTAANSKDAESEERLDALASILAEGLIYLAEHDLLKLDSEAPCSDLVVPSEESRSSNVPQRP